MPRLTGRQRRKSSEKLAGKLLLIRQALKESQGGLLRRLGLAEEFERDYVSKWERGMLEPQLFVICAYADAANVFVDVLVRDNLDLPLDIPAKSRSAGGIDSPEKS